MSSPIDPDAFNAFEAAGWDERAITYHRAFLPLTKQVIEPLLDGAGVGPGVRVLDVGSGPGYVAAAAAARDATAVGVDIAHTMVALARTIHPQVEFVHGGAEHLPFADDSFDAVVANFAIPHFGRPEQAVADFARVLSPGGKVALSTWDMPAASGCRACSTTPSRRSGRRHRRMCRPGRRSTASPTWPSSPACSATPGSSP
jgi:SAM-dependent methyltransferase